MQPDRRWPGLNEYQFYSSVVSEAEYRKVKSIKNMANDSFVDYEKFFLFGDSITQGACDQSNGFVVLFVL